MYEGVHLLVLRHSSHQVWCVDAALIRCRSPIAHSIIVNASAPLLLLLYNTQTYTHMNEFNCSHCFHKTIVAADATHTECINCCGAISDAIVARMHHCCWINYLLPTAAMRLYVCVCMTSESAAVVVALFIANMEELKNMKMFLCIYGILLPHVVESGILWEVLFVDDLLYFW